MPYNTSIRGWMTESELQVLSTWAEELPPNATIVEVGSFFGRSAYCFAVSAPTAIVHCYDWWGGGVVEDDVNFPMETRIKHGFPLPGDINSIYNFLSNTRACPNIRATQVQGVADLDWPIEPSVDLFFLDAGHVNPDDWEYIAYWLPRVRPGGWIAGHDLYPNRLMPAVNDNVERLQQLLGREVETPPAGSLWRIRK